MIATLVALGSIAYLNSLHSPFMFDDAGAVTQNIRIRQLWDVGVFSSPPSTPIAGRPLVNLSLALNYAFGGLDPFGYHVVNLALHLLCGVVLFLIVRTTLEFVRPGDSPRWIAFWSALLWLVHPLNSEVVDYVTQRTESMMAVCYLAAFYAAIRAYASSSLKWTWFATLLCLAGVACKETIVTAPIAAMLYDRAYLFDSFAAAVRARFRLYLGMCASWILAALLLRSGQTLTAGFASTESSVWSYALNQPRMILHYLWLTAWPHLLTLYYGWSAPTTLGENAVAIAVVALLAAGIRAAWVRNRRLAFPAVWALLTLAPTSSVIPIATEVGAERRMYLPLAGITTLVALGIWAVAVRMFAEPARSRRAAGAVIAALVLLLGGRTMARNLDYASPLTMARTILASWPTSNAHYLVGSELAAAGDRHEAIAELRVAAAGYPPARFDLGRLLVEDGETEEGVGELQQFIQREPDSLAARAAEGPIADALASRGSFAEAVPHYRKYLEAYPNDAAGWTGLGVSLAAAGQKTAAIDAFRAVTRLTPNDAHAQINLARSMIDAGDLDGAAAIVRQEITTHPESAPPYDLLGRILAARGDVAGARQAFEHALRIDPAFLPSREALVDLSRLR